MSQSCNFSIWEVEAKSAVQDYHWLHNESVEKEEIKKIYSTLSKTSTYPQEMKNLNSH